VVKRVAPGPGQESVWDYPRPPRLERSDKHVVVRLGGVVLADTTAAWRVLETSHPPVWYVPHSDLAAGTLRPTGRRAFKGEPGTRAGEPARARAARPEGPA
jgi:uncharacterized protein (DUF427 family)